MLSLLYRLYFSSKRFICFLIWHFSAMISCLFIHCIYSFTLWRIIIIAVLKFLSDNRSILDLTSVYWLFPWEWVTFFLFICYIILGFSMDIVNILLWRFRILLYCCEDVDGFYLEALYEMWLKMQILSMSLVGSSFSLSSDYSQSAPSICES